jgi:hypothetical protein
LARFLAVVVALGNAWTEWRHRLAAERHARELAQRARASQLTIKRETSLLRDQDGVFVRTTAECSFADVEVTYTTSDGEGVRQSLGVIRSAGGQDNRPVGGRTRAAASNEPAPRTTPVEPQGGP